MPIIEVLRLSSVGLCQKPSLCLREDHAPAADVRCTSGGHTGQRERVGPAVHGYLCGGQGWVVCHMAMGWRSPDHPLACRWETRGQGTEPVLERWVALPGLLTAIGQLLRGLRAEARRAGLGSVLV